MTSIHSSGTQKKIIFSQSLFSFLKNQIHRHIIDTEKETAAERLSELLQKQKLEGETMEHLIIPDNYQPELDLHDTQIAIKTVKDFFQNLLAERLNLQRVSAPLFVDPASGLNDNLNGVERPVTFGIKEQGEKTAEIVHSLAKWKRYALKKYGFAMGEGLYTDMNAIRRDEVTDNIHSIFVDQWDWEKVISKADRNLDYLKETVKNARSIPPRSGSF